MQRLTHQQRETLRRISLAAAIVATLALTIWRSHTNPWGWALPPAPTACQAAPNGQHAANAATIRRCLAREVMA